LIIGRGLTNKARKALVALAAQDERAPYGVNRAISGEIPTAENVFLGNRCGLWTKTVAYWEATRAEYTTQPAAIGRPHPTVMEVSGAFLFYLLLNILYTRYKFIVYISTYIFDKWNSFW
ncbi:MAG: hypothetical protein ACO3UU_02225, partial [Minisyncoccia bacterium]